MGNDNIVQYYKKYRKIRYAICTAFFSKSCFQFYHIML